MKKWDKQDWRKFNGAMTKEKRKWPCKPAIVELSNRFFNVKINGHDLNPVPIDESNPHAWRRYKWYKTVHSRAFREDHTRGYWRLIDRILSSTQWTLFQGQLMLNMDLKRHLEQMPCNEVKGAATWHKIYDEIRLHPVILEFSTVQADAAFFDFLRNCEAQGAGEMLGHLILASHCADHAWQHGYAAHVELENLVPGQNYVKALEIYNAAKAAHTLGK